MGLLSLGFDYKQNGVIMWIAAIFFWLYRNKYQNMSNCSTCIERFIQDGVTIFPSVITTEEVKNVRESLHLSLKRYGVDSENLGDTAKNIVKISSTGGSGGIVDIFYEEWKLKLNEHANVARIFSELFSATFSRCAGNYSHPYGNFDPNMMYMYIDRVCFRLPESIVNITDKKKNKLQRSLTPHLDCCPQTMFESVKEHPKWRPIQAFIALTDSLEPNHGGFEACLKHHLNFDDWTRRRANTVNRKTGMESPPPCVGEFTPMRPVEDRDVIAGFAPVHCRAGDLVVWDYRIPHANARFNLGAEPREVVYIGILPGVEMNKRYAEHQLQRYLEGKLPDDQWHESVEVQKCEYRFSSLGKRMMTMEPWPRGKDWNYNTTAGSRHA